jgi:hypothetical protein
MGGKGDCTPLSRNKKEPGAFSLHRDLPGGGVYDCITYRAWGQTSWFFPVNSLFLPIKRLRLRPLAGYYAAILHNFNINNFIISAHFINIPKKDDISPGYE